MGKTATIIALLYLVLVVVGVVIALGIWRSTRGRRSPAHTERLARRERVWFVVALGILVAGLGATIPFVPYGESAGAGKQGVGIVASQFAWRIEPSTVRVGLPVEFEFRATDVNHAFGLYDKDDILLLQVQVAPDHVQKAVYTFEEAGTYRVLCLEFCGAGHHVMESTIEVTAG
jgi:cytochrome c oxidase subunit 2